MSKSVWLIGMGCGPYTVTAAGMMAIESVKLIIGSERMLTLVPKSDARLVAKIHAKDIFDVIKEASETDIAVIFSGDIGFYSGATKLYEYLKTEDDIEVAMIPGVSVVQYFAARLGMPWQDMKLVSSHGLTIDPVSEVSGAQEVFFLTESGENLREIAKKLSEGGYGSNQAFIGEKLGYEDEKISSLSVDEATGYEADDLNVLLVITEK